MFFRSKCQLITLNILKHGSCISIAVIEYTRAKSQNGVYSANKQRYFNDFRAKYRRRHTHPEKLVFIIICQRKLVLSLVLEVDAP